MLQENYDKGTYRSELAKATVLRDMVKIMKDAGMSDKQAESHFTLDQKETLEEQKFIDAQKKRYGK